MILPGEQVVSLLKSAEKSALIVAPFMRSEALSRLLKQVPSGIETTIITRWRLIDLLSRASDLEVYNLADELNARLLLRSDLHAKLFAADGRCLVGSANVTLSAFGWWKSANFELLVPVRRDDTCIVDFERELIARAVPATAEQRDQLQNALERFRNSAPVILSVEDSAQATGSLPAHWVPQIKNPEELYAVYKGDADTGKSLLQIMREELTEIGVPPGLDEEGFRAWVAGTITQTPFVVAVMMRFQEHSEVTEADVASILQKLDVEAPDAHEVLEVVGRWLTYFLQEPHETTRDTVKLIKMRRIDPVST